jgi:hypothetical protein
VADETRRRAFSFPVAEQITTNEAQEMKRIAQELKKPYDGRDYRLVRAGPQGTYWQAGDGRSVRLAAAEAEAPVERARVSMLGILVALIASGATKR